MDEKKNNINVISCGIMISLRGDIMSYELGTVMESRIGEKHGTFTVVDLEKKRGKSGRYQYFYKCKCDCGYETTVRMDNWTKSGGRIRCDVCGGNKKVAAPKGITFHSKYNRYTARIKENGKYYNIGEFESVDIAAKVLEEAKKNIGNLDSWFMYERKKFILSLDPNYKFVGQRQNKKRVNDPECSVYSSDYSDVMIECIKIMKKNGRLKRVQKHWEAEDGSVCKSKTIIALAKRNELYFSDNGEECYLQRYQEG